MATPSPRVLPDCRERQRGSAIMTGNPETAGGRKQKILFICTANAARSQMAEGYLRAKYGDRYEAFSAGTRQSKISARAVAVMQEIGIDISHHESKTLDTLGHESFDLAVTLCDKACAVCPVMANATTTIHHPFADPHLTPGCYEEILDGYRKVRDSITAWIDRAFGGRGTVSV